MGIFNPKKNGKGSCRDTHFWGPRDTLREGLGWTKYENLSVPTAQGKGNIDPHIPLEGGQEERKENPRTPLAAPPG